VQEKKFIIEAIMHKKIVLGVCLGSQLIADALGGKVSRNKYKEIGWFPVSFTKEARNSQVFNTLPGRFTAFHWHGDTFRVPPGAMRIAESEGCASQAFDYRGRVIGLQFHLEYSKESINLMFQNCGSEIVDGKYIQKQDEIISQCNNVQETNLILNLLLDNIEIKFGDDFN